MVLPFCFNPYAPTRTIFKQKQETFGPRQDLWNSRFELNSWVIRPWTAPRKSEQLLS